MTENLTAPGNSHPKQAFLPVPEDEVIFTFLKSSEEIMSPDARRKLASITDYRTYKSRLVCRELCQTIGMLQHFHSRYWYRATIGHGQLKFVRLGHESSNNFSRYFSKKTYRPDIAATNIRTSGQLTDKQSMHRDKVILYSKSVEVADLRDVILCASKFTINRELKVLDGNHRMIALVSKYGRLLPFECIVGFSKPLYLSLLQRSLLAFPWFIDTRDASIFSIRVNLHRCKSRLSGGQSYQPLLRDGGELRQLATSVDNQLDVRLKAIQGSERPCTERARILRDDIRSIVGDFDDLTLLDIGCNVGFFCHFFASLGVKATGIDNSQHNRHQRFTGADSIQTAMKLNRRYGLACDFIMDDARTWAKSQNSRFDVVLLLSVLHHFFMGYPVGDYEKDSMEEAKQFIDNVARLTGKVLYIEYEDGTSPLPLNELVDYLETRGLFRKVEVVSYSDDFRRPIIRCLKL